MLVTDRLVAAERLRVVGLKFGYVMKSVSAVQPRKALLWNVQISVFMSMFVRLVQYANALLPMLVTEFGIVMLERLVQL